MCNKQALNDKVSNIVMDTLNNGYKLNLSKSFYKDFYKDNQFNIVLDKTTDKAYYVYTVSVNDNNHVFSITRKLFKNDFELYSIKTNYLNCGNDNYKALDDNDDKTKYNRLDDVITCDKDKKDNSKYNGATFSNIAVDLSDFSDLLKKVFG